MNICETLSACQVFPSALLNLSPQQLSGFMPLHLSHFFWMNKWAPRMFKWIAWNVWIWVRIFLTPEPCTFQTSLAPIEWLVPLVSLSSLSLSSLPLDFFEFVFQWQPVASKENWALVWLTRVSRASCSLHPSLFGVYTNDDLSRWFPETFSNYPCEKLTFWLGSATLPIWFFCVREESGLDCGKISLNGKVATFPPSPVALSVAREMASDTRALPNFGESWMVGRWDHLIPVKLPSCPEFSLAEHHPFITRLNCRIRKVLWASWDHTCMTTYLSLRIWSGAYWGQKKSTHITCGYISLALRFSVLCKCH